MEAFELSQLLSASDPVKEVQYAEFLRHPTLSMGLYSLKAGALDPQQPHNEDEVYYILSGQGSIRVGEEQQLVKAGSVVFVAAHEPHRFFNITEDLSILVFFAPAESSQTAKTEENGTSAS